MNEQHHGNLLGGAIGETTQTAAQLAAIAATAAQTVARVRTRRMVADHARDQAGANAERAVLRSEHAAARLAWAPAFERFVLPERSDASVHPVSKPPQDPQNLASTRLAWPHTGQITAGSSPPVLLPSGERGRWRRSCRRAGAPPAAVPHLC